MSKSFRKAAGKWRNHSNKWWKRMAHRLFRRRNKQKTQSICPENVDDVTFLAKLSEVSDAWDAKDKYYLDSDEISDEWRRKQLDKCRMRAILLIP